MNIISKRFRFNKLWEILMIDGQVYLLVKDVLPYFDLSPKSQGTVKEGAGEGNSMVIKGQAVRDLKHATSKALIINVEGLKNFISTMGATRKQKGQELIQYINGHAKPELMVQWKKKFGNMVMVDDLPFNDPPQDDPDMFDMIRELEVAELKQKVVDLEKRVADLEKAIKQDRLESMIESKDGKQVIDADALIKFLKGSDPRGNVR